MDHYFFLRLFFIMPPLPPIAFFMAGCDLRAPGALVAPNGIFFEEPFLREVFFMPPFLPPNLTPRAVLPPAGLCALGIEGFLVFLVAATFELLVANTYGMRTTAIAISPLALVHVATKRTATHGSGEKADTPKPVSGLAHVGVVSDCGSAHCTHEVPGSVNPGGIAKGSTLFSSDMRYARKS